LGWSKMKLEKSESNKLCANMGMTFTENMNKTLTKLGFMTVGDLVEYLEKYDEYMKLIDLFCGVGVGVDPDKLVQHIINLKDKAEILDMGQENSIFKVAKFCEMLAEWKRDNKQLEQENKQLRVYLENERNDPVTEALSNLYDTDAKIHLTVDTMIALKRKKDGN